MSIDLDQDRRMYIAARNEYLDLLSKYRSRINLCRATLDHYAAIGEEIQLEDWLAGEKFTPEEFLVAALKRTIDPLV